MRLESFELGQGRWKGGEPGKPPQVVLRAGCTHAEWSEVKECSRLPDGMRVPRSVPEVQCQHTAGGRRLQISLWQLCCFGAGVELLQGCVRLLGRCTRVKSRQPGPCRQRLAETGVVPRAEGGVLGEAGQKTPGTATPESVRQARSG